MALLELTVDTMMIFGVVWLLWVGYIVFSVWRER